MSNNQTNSELSQRGSPVADRDRRILEHVARFRIATPDSLRATVLRSLSLNAIRKILRRLCAAGSLQQFTLQHPRVYVILGERGLRLLGLGLHRGQPPGPQALPQDYAVLNYATQGQVPRIRLTTAEVLQRCHWLPSSAAKAPHCLDASQTLELVRVDLGGPADHVARKAFHDIRKRSQPREFNAMLRARQFRLVILTSSSGKSAAIRRACERHEWPDDLALHVVTVPQLVSLRSSSHA